MSSSELSLKVTSLEAQIAKMQKQASCKIVKQELLAQEVTSLEKQVSDLQKMVQDAVSRVQSMTDLLGLQGHARQCGDELLSSPASLEKQSAVCCKISTESKKSFSRNWWWSGRWSSAPDQGVAHPEALSQELPQNSNIINAPDMSENIAAVGG